MKSRLISGVLLALLCLDLPVRAEEHLLSTEISQARLADATRDRKERIAALEDLLDTPEAARVGEVAGINIARVKRYLPLLSDVELRELSLRAEGLRINPVAGMSNTAGTLLVIVLLGTIIVIALAVYSWSQVEG